MPKKQWYESKVIWIAIATGALGIITAVETQYGTIGVLVTLKSILDIFLRFETSTAIQ